MSIAELATSFTALCAQGKFDEAGERYWAESVVSREPFPGPEATASGLDAVRAKGVRWAENHTIHSVEVAGPFVSGEQFVVRFTMDITPKGKPRVRMDEVGLYTVKDGKIVDESFFYAT